MARTPGYEPGGCRFKSCQEYQCSRSSIGRTPRFEREGCWFESSREYHFHACVVQLAETAGSDPVMCWFESNRRYQYFCPRSPTGRGNRLKIGPVPVRARPWAPWEQGVPLNGRQLVLKTRVGNASQGFDSSTLCRSMIGALTGQASRPRLLNAGFPCGGMGCKSSALCQFSGSVTQLARVPGS
jgi:hypothetical protein